MRRIFGALAIVMVTATAAHAQSVMCDPAYENCRIPLVAAMDAEMVGIDMFIWFAEDDRYIAALNRAKARGVRIRVLANNRWSSGPRYTFMQRLKQYAIPTRVARSTPSHIKAMVLQGQGKVFLTGGNYTSNAMNPVIPYVNYIDEVVQFTTEPAIVQSFARLFDDMWANNNILTNFCGVINLARIYGPTAPPDPRLQYGTGSMTAQLQRLVAKMDAESVGIDTVMYRLNDTYTRAAIIRALGRGVPVRILSDPEQYQEYAGMKPYMDAVIAAGAQVRWRVHAGMTHEKLVIFHSDGTAVIPTNNFDTWSSYSIAFYTQESYVYEWSVNHFNRKWNSPSEFK